MGGRCGEGGGGKDVGETALAECILFLTACVDVIDCALRALQLGSLCVLRTRSLASVLRTR